MVSIRKLITNFKRYLNPNKETNEKLDKIVKEKIILEDIETCTLQEILDHFNLDINLPEYLYSEHFSCAFKKADLEIEEDIYKFRLGSTLLTISPNEYELIRLEDDRKYTHRQGYTKDFSYIT